ALGSLLAALLNTGGPKLLLAPFQIEQDIGHVTEWAPPTLTFVTQQEPVAGLFALIIILAFAFGRDPDTDSRVPTAWDLGTVVLAFLLASNAVRLIAVGAVVATPAIIRRLTPVIPTTKTTWVAGALGPWMLAAWLLLRGGTTLGVGFEPDHFPEKAVQFIQRHQPSGRMWNSSVYGGYLSWRLYPAYRVLMDGRTSWVHEPRVISLARRSETNHAAFTALVEEFDIQWAICRAVEGERFGLPLAADGGWVMVYWDDVSAVYVSKSAPNAHLAASGYRLLRHATPLPRVLAMAAQSERTVELTHDASLAAAQAPASPRAAFLQACAALGRREEAAFHEAVARVRHRSERPEPARVLERVWSEVVGP
ncbi:MAG: hypothetical protein ACOC1F_01885, partial [Myxococcota bacterium]